MRIKDMKKFFIVFISVFFASMIQAEGMGEPYVQPGVAVAVSFAFAWGGQVSPGIFLGLFAGEGARLFLLGTSPLHRYYEGNLLPLLFFPLVITFGIIVMDYARIHLKKENLNLSEPKDLMSFLSLITIFTLILSFFGFLAFKERDVVRGIHFFLLSFADILMLTPVLYLVMTKKFLLYLKSKKSAQKQMGMALIFLILFGLFTIGPLKEWFYTPVDLDITIVIPMMFVAIFLGQAANGVQMALVWILGLWGFAVHSHMGEIGHLSIEPPADFSIFMISIGIIILWVTAISESLKRRSLYLEIQNEMLTENEEKIRNSEKRLDVIFRSSPITILLVNLSNAEIVDCNEQTTKTLGYEKEELIGMNAFSFGLWDSEEEKMSYISLLNENGRIEEHEVKISHKDGTTRTFMGSTESIEIEGMSFAITALVDITENKKNQVRIELFNEELECTVKQRTQDLFDAKEFTEQILSSIPVGVFTFDQEGRFISANEIGAEMLDTTVSQLIGRTFSEKNIWKDHGLEKLAEWTMETGESTKLEGLFKTDLEKLIWLECSFSRFYSGEQNYLLMVINDVTERHTSEKLLKEAKEFNEKVLRNSPIGIFTYRSDGQCITVNEMASKITGETNEELRAYNYKTGGTWEQFGLRALADETMETGVDGSMEANLSMMVGRKSWQEFRTTKFISGEEEFLLVMLNDITARKEVEQALKNAENKLRTMTNNLPLVVFQAKFGENKFEFTFVNEVCYEAFGIPSGSQIMVNSILDLMLEADRHEVVEIFLNAAERKIPWKADFRIEKDGSLRWFHSEAIPVDGENEELLWNGYLQDTTERRTAEADANLFFKTSIDLMAISDLDGSFMRVSPSWENVLGWEEEELQGRSFREFIHYEDLENVQKELNKFKEGGTVISFVSRFRCKDGSYRWLSWNSHNQGERGILLSLARDITESKRVEQALIEAKNAAEGADKSKSEFLANMSHEIRTPLNAVIGFSEILGGQDTEPKQKVYLDAINTAGKSLLRLINDILDLSKIEAGMMAVNYGPVNTTNIFKEIEQIFKMTVHEKGIEFITEIDETIPKVLMLDEARVRQVLLNLVGNAVKFTESGFIKLKVVKRNIDSEGKKIDLILAVQDTGIGINKNELNEVFHSFRQQYGQSNRKYGGTGLGLSISKRLVELMNGRIELESEQGVGSTFTVYLRDITVASFERVDNPELYKEKVIFNGEKVLVVDDVESNRELVREQLQMVGLKVYTAVNGEDAIYKVENLKPTLVLMDLMMPIMDGEEAAMQIKDNDDLRDIPIIALTASARIRSFKEMENSPFSGYLSKPVSAKHLYAEVQRFIRGNDAGEAVSLIEPGKEESQITGAEKEYHYLSKGEVEQFKETLGTSLTNLNKGLRRSAAIEFVKQLEEMGSTFESRWVLNEAEALSVAIGNTDIEKATAIIKELYEEIYGSN